MGSISRRVLFALGIGAAAAGRLQAQAASSEDLPTCRLSGDRGEWELTSELTSIAEGVAKVTDTLRIADANHVVSITAFREGSDLSSGALRIVIRNAPVRESRPFGQEQQPVGLAVDGGSVRVGEMSLDRRTSGSDAGMVAGFSLSRDNLASLLAQLEAGSRMVVQSVIAVEGSEDLSDVASDFDVAPLQDIDRTFARARTSMEASLRARQCEPQAGGCHLTTVCCGMIGLADDCWELRTLRAFRDGWLVRQESGRADIARYYREAPEIARALASDPGAARRVYRRFVLPSAAMAYLGWNRAAWGLYRKGSAYAAACCRSQGPDRA